MLPGKPHRRLCSRAGHIGPPLRIALDRAWPGCDGCRTLIHSLDQLLQGMPQAAGGTGFRPHQVQLKPMGQMFLIDCLLVGTVAAHMALEPLLGIPYCFGTLRGCHVRRQLKPLPNPVPTARGQTANEPSLVFPLGINDGDRNVQVQFRRLPSQVGCFLWRTFLVGIQEHKNRCTTFDNRISKVLLEFPQQGRLASCRYGLGNRYVKAVAFARDFANQARNGFLVSRAFHNGHDAGTPTHAATPIPPCGEVHRERRDASSLPPSGNRPRP